MALDKLGQAADKLADIGTVMAFMQDRLAGASLLFADSELRQMALIDTIPRLEMMRDRIDRLIADLRLDRKES